MRCLTFIEIDLESCRRGGTTRVAECLCGWRGPERGTLELAFDDAQTHERQSHSAKTKLRRAELVRRLASNKKWMSENYWDADKAVRDDCRANITSDEHELTLIDAEANDASQALDRRA